MTTYERFIRIRLASYDRDALRAVNENAIQGVVSRTVFAVERDQMILTTIVENSPTREVSDDPRPTSDDPPES